MDGKALKQTTKELKQDLPVKITLALDSSASRQSWLYLLHLPDRLAHTKAFDLRAIFEIDRAYNKRLRNIIYKSAKALCRQRPNLKWNFFAIFVPNHSRSRWWSTGKCIKSIFRCSLAFE